MCLLEISPEQGARVKTRLSRLAVKRAEAYLREHLGRTVPMYELAEIIECPFRTLSYGFKSEFGISPYTFHRLLRMQAAHNDLLCQSPDSTSVTRTALTYGFEHFGRFSVCYKQHFGETPRETLRRRSPFQQHSPRSLERTRPHGDAGS